VHDDGLVITGSGLVCRLGDDRDTVAARIRAAESPPFHRWQPAVDAGCGCHLIGRCDADLSDDILGVDRRASRFMGRSARLALKAARAALAESGVATDGLAVVVGSGTGDVDTHVEIEERLQRGGRVRPTVIPRLMASTVSANLVNVLGSTGPSVSAAAACAGGAWNVVIAAQLVREGHAVAALAGGAEAADLHFHSGFHAMRAVPTTTVPSARVVRTPRIGRASCSARGPGWS
jgi:3-oxoacyl-[acyl-carrier-protein] synthase-1